MVVQKGLLCVPLLCFIAIASAITVNSSNPTKQPNGFLEVTSQLAERIEMFETKMKKISYLEERVRRLEETHISEKVSAKTDRTNYVDKQPQKFWKMGDGNDKKLRLTTEKHAQLVKNREVREVQNPAFSVVLTKSLRNLGIHQVIKFDRVLLNDDNCYETHTGIFTAPVAGRYLFIYNFGLHGSTETWLQLVKNGASQNRVGVEGKATYQNLQGGNAAIIYLNQGDDVWIETAILSDVTVEHYSTTFSGALLY